MSPAPTRTAGGGAVGGGAVGGTCVGGGVGWIGVGAAVGGGVGWIGVGAGVGGRVGVATGFGVFFGPACDGLAPAAASRSVRIPSAMIGSAPMTAITTSASDSRRSFSIIR
jgi:hypothetical protein